MLKMEGNGGFEWKGRKIDGQGGKRELKKTGKKWKE